MIIEGPENFSAAPGQDALFLCQVTGAPPPTVEWLINGSYPAYNRRVQIDTFEGPDPLTIYKISKVRPEDRADITCYSKNIAGEIRQTARFEVQGKLNRHVGHM